MKNEEKKPRISEEIDGKIDLIRKNIEFCQTNGMPEALETGGKYFKSFSELISDTVSMELEHLGATLRKMFPFLPNTKEGEHLAQIIQTTIDNNHDRFADIQQCSRETGKKLCRRKKGVFIPYISCRRTGQCRDVQYNRDSQSKQTECVPVSLYGTALHAGLQK